MCFVLISHSLYLWRIRCDLFCYVRKAQNRAYLPTRGLIVSELHATIRFLVEWPTVAYLFLGYLAIMESSTGWYNGGTSEVKIPRVLYEMSSVAHQEEI